jgi:uncharacterized protein
MTAVFADTFYWIAITNIKDDAHAKAKSFALSAQRGMIFTTEEVLTEYLNYFGAWGSGFRGKASANVVIMRENRTVEIAPQTSASFLGGFALYRARLDKDYSLTDCISMQAMRNRRITDVLTNDLHFEQEGFRALFRDY